MSEGAASGLAVRPAHVPEDRVVAFDLYNPPGVADGCPLQDAWKTLQDEGVPSVVWTPCNEGHWIITRARLIRKALLDTRNLSNTILFIPKSSGADYPFIPSTVDPPLHRPYRTIMSRAIEARLRSDRFEDEISDIAGDLVRSLVPLGGCEFVKDFAQPFPFMVLVRLLDFPYEDTPRLKILADQLTRPDGSMTMAEAIQAFYDYLEPIIVERRARPGDDVISTIIQGTIEGRPLTMEETQNICCLALFAGLDTVVNGLSFMFHYLATHPEKMAQLRADPDLVPDASEELLRRFPVAALARLAVNDVEIDGVTILAGEMVLVPSMLTGIDEDMNRCPMDVDFHREAPRHLTFGAGIHVCAGAPIARREVVAALRAWIAHCPDFRLAPDARVRHQGGIVGAVQSLALVWAPPEA